MVMHLAGYSEACGARWSVCHKRVAITLVKPMEDIINELQPSLPPNPNSISIRNARYLIHQMVSAYRRNLSAVCDLECLWTPAYEFRSKEVWPRLDLSKQALALWLWASAATLGAATPLFMTDLSWALTFLSPPYPFNFLLCFFTSSLQNIRTRLGGCFVKDVNGMKLKVMMRGTGFLIISVYRWTAWL